MSQAAPERERIPGTNSEAVDVMVAAMETAMAVAQKEIDDRQLLAGVDVGGNSVYSRTRTRAIEVIRAKFSELSLIQ